MLHENLKGRVAVVTGGGGVLCGDFAKTLAKQGVKVAVLDLNEEAAQKVADEIVADGGVAIAVGCNVLEKESMEKAREIVNEKLGTCDILLNGAGGNNPKGTTTKETLEKIDLIEKNDDIKTFFDLDANGISFVFNLNFLGTLIPTSRLLRFSLRRRRKGSHPGAGGHAAGDRHCGLSCDQKEHSHARLPAGGAGRCGAYGAGKHHRCPGHQGAEQNRI